MKSHERIPILSGRHSLNQTLVEQKIALREAVRHARKSLEYRNERSRKICARLNDWNLFQKCESPLLFIGYRSEVVTFPLIEDRLLNQKRTLIPWCDRDELRLFVLRSISDLEEGSYRILEPKQELKGLTERQVSAYFPDLILVPGLAYDRSGGRLGQGKGYYDKLLSRVPETTTLVGLGFDCQLVEQIPMEPHDVRLHFIVTESEIVACRKPN